MTWTAVAIGGGALLNAGTTLAGGMSASQGQSQKAIPVAGVDPYKDPVLNATQLITLQSLGFPVDSLLQRASPLMQLQNALSAPNAGTADRKRAQKTTQAVAMLTSEVRNSLIPGHKTMDEVLAAVNRMGYRPWLIQAAGLAGYAGIEDLINAEVNFQKGIGSLKAQAEATAPAIQAGRAAAQTGIADIQHLVPSLATEIASKTLPTVTDAEILAASEAERQRQREAVLQQANVGGFNPAAGLSNIERDPNPLLNAINLLTAKQALGVTDINAAIAKGQGLNSAFDALYKSIYGPLESANQTATTTLNTATGNAQVGANLAQTGAASQANAATSRGNAIAGAGNAAASGLTTLALINALNKQPGATDQTWLPTWLQSP